MCYRFFGSMGLAAGALLVLLPAAAAAAQSLGEDGWTAPSTAWGDPDLQGLWTSATLTPLERPAQQMERALLTDEEAASLEQESAQQRAASDGKSAPGSVGGYNQVWLDAGTRIVGDRRTSLIVDPPEGVIPWIPEKKVETQSRAGPLRRRPLLLLYRPRHGRALHHRRPAQHGPAAALQHEHAHPPDPGAGGDAAPRCTTNCG